MAERQDDNEDLIAAYKELLRGYLAVRPSGLRKKISEAIGTNRSFVSQITNPNYRVPVPPHYVQIIMDVCHLSPAERGMFLNAYITAHPAHAELSGRQQVPRETGMFIDLSAVRDDETRDQIRRSLRVVAETMIAMSLRDSPDSGNGGT
jgi:hypothetical protein